MDANQTIVASYEHSYMPFAFDVVIHVLFAPFGGVDKLRRDMIERSGIRAGQSVLELGCGTGSVTKLLLTTGAEVTAVDGSEHMLARARRRAPNATFVRSTLESFEPHGAFDVVLFAFVLHELPGALRPQVIRAAARALKPGGRIAILDHAVPRGRGFAHGWRKILMHFEPPSVVDCIEHGYARELEAEGLRVQEILPLASGVAAVTLTQPR